MELYQSIEDFPIYNWFKCIDTKDYTYCLVKRKECDKKELDKCIEAFGLMYAQYVDRFGISETLKEILELKSQIAIYKNDMSITGDRSSQMFIDIKQIDLNTLLNKKESKTNTSKVAIEKYLNRHIDMRAITVIEYYEYLEAIKEDHGRASDTK